MWIKKTRNGEAPFDGLNGMRRSGPLLASGAEPLTAKRSPALSVPRTARLAAKHLATARAGNPDGGSLEELEMAPAAPASRLRAARASVSREVGYSEAAARHAAGEPSPERGTACFPPANPELAARKRAGHATILYDRAHSAVLLFADMSQRLRPRPCGAPSPFLLRSALRRGSIQTAAGATGARDSGEQAVGVVRRFARPIHPTASVRIERTR